MFEYAYLEKLIKACEAGIKETRYGIEYITAVQENLDFWLNTKNNKANQDLKPKNGTYVIIRCTATKNEEWTNIGFMIFDNDGKQILCRIGPLSRAIYRGDLTEETQKFVDLNQYGKKYQTIDDVYRSLDSLGHLMGKIQITMPRMIKLEQENYQSIYHSFILGLER